MSEAKNYRGPVRVDSSDLSIPLSQGLLPIFGCDIKALKSEGLVDNYHHQRLLKDYIFGDDTATIFLPVYGHEIQFMVRDFIIYAQLPDGANIPYYIAEDEKTQEKIMHLSVNPSIEQVLKDIKFLGSSLNEFVNDSSVSTDVFGLLYWRNDDGSVGCRGGIRSNAYSENETFEALMRLKENLGEFGDGIDIRNPEYAGFAEHVGRDENGPYVSGDTLESAVKTTIGILTSELSEKNDKNALKRRQEERERDENMHPFGVVLH